MIEIESQYAAMQPTNLWCNKKSVQPIILSVKHLNHKCLKALETASKTSVGYSNNNINVNRCSMKVKCWMTLHVRTATATGVPHSITHACNTLNNNLISTVYFISLVFNVFRLSELLICLNTWQSDHFIQIERKHFYFCFLWREKKFTFVFFCCC